MRNLKDKTKKGFTLIEVVIYIAIFSIMVIFVMGTLWSFGSSTLANRNRNAVNAEANFVFQKMVAAVSGASSVSEPAVSASSSALTFSKYSYGQNPIKFYLASGTLFMQRGASPGVSLLSENVKVNSLNFQHNPEVVSMPESLGISISVAASSSELNAISSTTLRTTIYLRK